MKNTHHSLKAFHSERSRIRREALSVIGEVEHAAALAVPVPGMGHLPSFAMAMVLLGLSIALVGATPARLAEEAQQHQAQVAIETAFTSAEEVMHSTESSQVSYRFMKHWEDPLRAQKQMGIYVNSNNAKDPTHYKRLTKQLNRRGVAAVVFDVKDYYVYIETDAAIANDLKTVKPLYELPKLVKQAQKEGLYTIARYVAAKDPLLGYRRGDLRLRHPDTGNPMETEWVEPANPTVLEYNRQILVEVAKSGIDEINLDYIRYPTEQPQVLGRIPTDEKIRNVETFIKMTREVIDEYGPDTKLGISTFAILGWNYELNLKSLAQDVVRFAPYVDVISPMAYPATFSEGGGYYVKGVHKGSRMYHLVKRTMTGYNDLLGDHAWKLRPWIQGYFTTSTDMIDQMEAVFDSGHCGFTIWSIGNYYDSFYSALRKWEGEVPDRCQLRSITPKPVTA